jgi:alpha-beta hydrolase superfamily lysophospholipase
MLEQTVESYDKTKIAFNHFKQQDRDTIIVICHGIGMCKDAKPFLDLSKDFFNNYDVITMDQRGHGNSGGIFSFSAKEHEDIKVVINYAKKIYKHVYLMGFSFGAASSIIQVAREKNVDGLIVVSPPISFEEIENLFLDIGALVPGIQKIGSHLFKLRLGSIRKKKIRPIDVIEQISPIPLLIIQGEKDPIIFKRHAETLFEKAKEPKRIIMIKGGLHAEELYRQNPKDFMSCCASWLQGEEFFR